MKKGKTAKKGISLAFCDLPIGEREKIEVVRVGKERRAVLNGVAKILQYDAACMAFLMGKERLELHGKSLSCVSYMNGAIGIAGKIEEIVFLGVEKE